MTSDQITSRPDKPRRKYRYRSRQAAEEAQAASERAAHDNYRLALALHTKTIQWTKTRESYRLGVFDLESPTGPKVVQVFDPGTQTPSLTVMELYGNEYHTQERLTARNAADPEAFALLDLMERARVIAIEGGGS